MQIDFQDDTNSVAFNYTDLLQQLLLFTAEKENVSKNTEVSIMFVDNKKIQELNFRYRNKDKVTDVLSFALDLSNHEQKGIPLPLGDIVISIEQAEKQAKEYQHSLKRELGFLTVHGFLHLLGYDHMDFKDEKKMFQRQKDILKEFGLER